MEQKGFRKKRCGVIVFKKQLWSQLESQVPSFRENSGFCFSCFARWRLVVCMNVLFVCLSASAQLGINTAGGDFSTNKGSLSYSLGQTFSFSASAPTGSFIAGVQQTYSVPPVGIDATLDASPEVRVYPNPVTKFLTVVCPEEAGTHILLADISGKTILVQDISSVETNLNVSHLDNGLYLLRICREGESSKVFKIMKK